MAILSSVRSRRGRKAEATQQLIAFRLRHEWFALPIEFVYRVVTMGKVFGDPGHTGVALTHFENQELLVIDVGQRIFSDNTGAGESDIDLSEHRCLLVLKNAEGGLVGLPLDSQPEVRRIPRSQFVPLPATYTALSKIRCISSLMVQVADGPPLFLLDPDQVGVA